MTQSRRTSKHAVQRAIEASDALQVELLGQYSLSRLHEMLAYSRRCRLATAVAILVLMPFPCLLAILLLDSLPLNSPQLGVYHQTKSFWFRVAFSVGVITFCVIEQIRICNPSLPMTNTRMWVVSIGLGIAAIGEFFGLGVWIGFPTPFALQLTAMPWFNVLCGVLWTSFKTTLRADKEAMRNFTRYLQVYASQLTIVFVYPTYYYLYTLLGGRGQTIASVGFTVIKLVFRYWDYYGLFNLEDLAPAVIVFNVDVFHALFVSSTMQSATSSGTIIATMVVDVMQCCTAYYQVGIRIRHVEMLATKAQKLEAKDSGIDVMGVRSKFSPVAYALHALESNERVREDPRVAIPRNIRVLERIPRNIRVLERMKSRTKVTAPPQTVPANTVQTTLLDEKDSMKPKRQPLTDVEQLQVRGITTLLKIMHMTEFFVLVEFVEVLIPALYSLYLFAMSSLPNHVYYTQLARLTTHQIQAKAAYVGFYAVLELLSLIGFCVALDRRLQEFSTIRQVTFVLHKHKMTVQAWILLWVLYVVQLSLEHAGTDYTFKFKWLHHESL